MPIKIYYLDDEQALCEIFEDYYSNENVIVTTFIDAKKAIETIKLNPPDMLFLDYRLLGTTGDEVAMFLNPDYPVFLITGDISIKTKFNFKKIFLKPYKEVEIEEVIQSYQSNFL